MKNGDFYLYYSAEDQQKLVDKFGTTDKQKLKKLMHDSILEKSKSLDSEQSSTEQTPEDETLDTKIKRLKAADLTLKVWEKMRSDYTLEDFQNFLQTGFLPQKRLTYDYLENPHKSIIETSNPPNPNLEHNFKTLGTTIINKPKQILQEDGTLRCKNCNKKFDMRAFDFEQLDDYRIHFETVHRKLTDRERDELMGIYQN
jgi:hypothetical protein